MSYTIYNIKNVLSQYFKLDVSKIDLELENFFISVSECDYFFYTLKYNKNNIQINYRLDKNKNIKCFSIRINYNDNLNYDEPFKNFEINLVKSDNLIIYKIIKNNIIYCLKKQNTNGIFIYNFNINKLLLKSIKIKKSTNYRFNYRYSSDIQKVKKVYYINYYIFYKYYLTNKITFIDINLLKISDNSILQKLLI